MNEQWISSFYLYIFMDDEKKNDYAYTAEAEGKNNATNKDEDKKSTYTHTTKLNDDRKSVM